jgi:hypothetical protein
MRNHHPSITPVPQLLKNFPKFYGSRRFITIFTRALHWPLSWAWWIQSIPPHPTSLRSIFILPSHSGLGLSILILSTHLYLDLLSGFFPSGFPPKSYMQFASPHVCYMPCPSSWTSLFWLYFANSSSYEATIYIHITDFFLLMKYYYITDMLWSSVAIL